MDDKKIDDIVSMIDQFMSVGGGHMNVAVSESGVVSTEETISKTVTKMSSLDCAQGDMACQVPTLFQGLDAADDPDSDVDE